MSWGDPQTARELNTDQHPALSTLLLQCTGPSRVYLHDSKWKALLHHYNILVHLDEGNILTSTVCKSMAKHASKSGNLAALALHCSKMLRDLTRAVQQMSFDPSGGSATSPTMIVRTRSRSDASVTSIGSSSVSSFHTNNTRKNVASTKASFVLIGKARATCGALNLMRLFVHRTILSGGVFGSGSLDDDAFTCASPDTLERAFIYVEPTSAGGMCVRSRDAVEELLSALIQFLDSQGTCVHIIHSVHVFLHRFV